VIGSVTLFSLITFDTCSLDSTIRHNTSLTCSVIPAVKIYTLVGAHGHPSVNGEALACALQRWGRWDTFTTAVDLNLVIWIMDILVVRKIVLMITLVPVRV
jgi:hypothetical protein